MSVIIPQSSLSLKTLDNRESLQCGLSSSFHPFFTQQLRGIFREVWLGLVSLKTLLAAAALRMDSKALSRAHTSFGVWRGPNNTPTLNSGHLLLFLKLPSHRTPPLCCDPFCLEPSLPHFFTLPIINHHVGGYVCHFLRLGSLWFILRILSEIYFNEWCVWKS